MSILNVIETEAPPEAPVIIIAGKQGVGKTTFASKAENPLLIDIEGGSKGLRNVARVNKANLSTYENVLEVLRAVPDTNHTTIILDSLDHLEPLVWAKVCTENQVNNIEDFGYGKGYIHAEALWRQFWVALNWLASSRNITVICICHVNVSQVSDPIHGDHTSTTLKMHKRAAALATESADIIGMAVMEHYILTDKDGQKKASKGEHKLLIAADPNHIAKCRYAGMPESLPLNWHDFHAAFTNCTQE